SATVGAYNQAEAAVRETVHEIDDTVQDFIRRRPLDSARRRVRGWLCLRPHSPLATQQQRTLMDQDRIAGTARNVAGKVQNGVGAMVGDAATEAEGLMNQAAGAVQDAYGQAKDATAEGAQKIKDVAVETHDVLRKFIEEKPHTATALAL